MNRYQWTSGHKVDLSEYEFCSVCGCGYKHIHDGCLHVFPYVTKMGGDMMGDLNLQTVSNGEFTFPNRPIMPRATLRHG